MVAGKGKVRGNLVVTTESVIFAPDKPTELRVVLKRGKSLAVSASNGVLVCDAGAEGSAQFVLSNAEAAANLATELNRGDTIPEKPTARQMELCASEKFGSMFLNVVRAKNLLGLDTTGKSDPFVRATLLYKEPGKDKFKEHDETTLQTKYVEQNVEPTWNEMLHWDISDVMPDSIKVRILDYDVMGGDDLIGHCVIPVADSPKAPRDEWLLLSTDMGFGINAALKTTFAVTRKVQAVAKNVAKETAREAGGAMGIKGHKSPRKSPRKEPLEAGEPEIRDGGVEQYVHLVSSFKKSVGTPCCMLVGTQEIRGALFMYESRFVFLNEEGRSLMDAPYTQMVSFEWVEKQVICETTESIFVFRDFLSKVNYQAMYNAQHSKFGTASLLTKKGHVLRMPSILNLEGFVPLPTGAELTVNITEGMKLVAKDKVNGEYTASDPYCTVALLDPQQKPFSESQQETRVVHASLMPVWDQNFRFVVPPGAIALVITVWDKDAGGIISNNDDFMGQAILGGKDIRDLLETTGQWEGWRKLEARAGRKERVSGKLRISLTMDPNALADDVEAVPEFGIDMFNPTRRKSITLLDFDVHNKFTTFNGTYRGQNCRVWVSDEGTAMYGPDVRLRAGWNHVVRIHEKVIKEHGKMRLQGVELRGPFRSVYIHEPEAKGLRRLEATFQRYKEAMSRTARKPDGDPPSSMSFIRMHPFLTLLIHGSLTGNHFKTLALLWAVISSYLWLHLTYPGPVIPRIFVTIGVLSILSWFVEHVEFGMDWEALIREKDFPLVEKDILDAQRGANTTWTTRILAIISGTMFLAAGSIPNVSTPSLAFPFVAALLVLVRTMLTFRR